MKKNKKYKIAFKKLLKSSEKAIKKKKKIERKNIENRISKC